MKLTFTTFDVMVSVSEIRNRILGHRIINVYDVDNKTYLLKLNGTQSEDKAILLLESGSRIHITDFEWPKNMMPSGFSMKLRKHIRNKKIVDITQVGADRIVDIQIGFESSAYHLIVELYDKGNMLLADDSYTILHLLRPRTDKSQNIRFAAHEKYLTDSCRKVLDCFKDLNEEKSLSDIESFLTPLFQSSKGPWTSDAQASENPPINKTLSLELPYGNIVIEHCMRVAQKEVKRMKCSEDNFQSKLIGIDLMGHYVKFFATALRDILLKAYSVNQATPCGYIFGKPDPSAEGLRSYEEFQPFIFEQYAGRPHVMFDSFNKAVDTYFSKLESQRTSEQILRNEQKANKKVENIKKDQERRLMALKTEQEANMHCAYLLEANHQLVDNIILMLNHALYNQLDWTELESIVEEAKQRGDPLAWRIVELKLLSNQAVILLKDPFEVSSDGENTGDSSKTDYTQVTIDLDLNALNNARKYYNKKRVASKKEEKTINASRKVLKSATHKAEITRKTAKTVAQITEVRKPMWFEKFFWFISSENYLIVAGRDSQQNEVLVKRYLKSGDIFVHADIHGASTVIVKARHLTSEEISSSRYQDNTMDKTHSLPLPPPKTLLEAGNMAVALSSAWTSHILTRAWWVHHHQVSKTAPSGEYLTTGAFMIRGKKNYLPPCPFDYGFGIMFKLHEDSIAKHKGERRIIVLDTPSSEQLEDKMERLTFQNDEEISEFPNTILQLDLANDLSKPLNSPSPKDADESEIVPEVLPKKVKMNSPKVDKSKSCKKTNKAANVDKEVVKENEKSHETQVPSKQQPLKRGLKSKLKKIKQKYSEQDEDERLLRMKILQGGDAKPSQYHQILERDNLSSQNNEEKSTPDNETICGQDSDNDDDDDEKKDELCVDDEAEPLSSPTHADDNHSIKSSEKSLQDLEVEDAIDNEEFSDETKEDDLIQMLNSLTGQPYEDDLLLYAIPVCGPYSAMLKYKYRVKLNPGITKRGKASKMAMFQFTSDKSATNRERELMRAMKDEEVPRNFPGCVKISLPQGKTLKKK